MSRPETWRRRLRRRWKNRPGLVPWLLAAPQRLFFRLLRLLPDRAVLAVGDRLGRLAWLVPRRRELGRRHLARALPCRTAGERDRILRRSCGHLGRAAAEAMVLWPKHEPEWFRGRIAVAPQARELLAAWRGRGAIVIQAHLGSIEATSTLLALEGLRPATPMRLPRNHYLARDLLRARNRGAAEVLPRQGAVKRMLRHLGGGGSLVLTFDQNAHHKPVFVPWFGHPAATERTPAALALRTGAPVLAAWTVRRPTGGAAWDFHLALVRDRQPPATADEAAVTRLTASFHRVLEEIVLRHPEQYLWIHDRYRSRPPSP